MTDQRWHAPYKRARKALLASRPPCIYCGRPATEADHRVPVKLGGTDDPANLVPACRTCNRSRGAKSMAEFMARQSRQPEWLPRTVYAVRRAGLRPDYTR